MKLLQNQTLKYLSNHIVIHLQYLRRLSDQVVKDNEFLITKCTILKMARDNTKEKYAQGIILKTNLIKFSS